jgi:hypothetical protein
MDHSSPRRWLLNLLVGAGLSAIAAASLAAPQVGPTFHGPWIGITHRWFQETFASLWVRTARNTSEKLTKSISLRT